MNPEQPAREQIEARITALLVGELPAAEAELLRFTISRDPELQKLHDQLKVTIGFVREAMHHPTGASVEREAPQKLAQERRQKLLAHFKTTRPEPPLIPFWRRHFKVSPLIGALAAVAIIALLVAVSLPNFVKARSTSQSNAIINNLRQIDAAKQEWALEQKKSADDVPTVNDLTPYLAGQTMHSVAGENYVLGKVSQPTVAEMNGKQLIAQRGTYGSEASTTSGPETTTLADNGGATSQQNATINNMRQITAAVNEWKLETGKSHVSPNSPGESTVTQLPKIALPKTESTENDTDRNAVFSQNVVGYVNIAPGASSATSQLGSAPPPPTVAVATPPPAPSAPEAQPETGQIFVTPSDSGRTYATNFGELSAVQAGASTASMQPVPNSAPTIVMSSPPAPSTASAAQAQPAASAVPTFNFDAGSPRVEPPKAPPPHPVSAPPQVVETTPVAESARPDSFGLASRENANASADNESAVYYTNSISKGLEDLSQVMVTASASKSENPSTAPLLPPRMRHYERFGPENGPEGQIQADQPQHSTTPRREEEQIQPIPAGGTYASSAAAPEVVLQPRIQPNAGPQEPAVNGSNIYLGIGGGAGGVSAPNAKGFDGYLGQQVAPSGAVVPIRQSSNNGTVSFGISAGNGPFANRLQNSINGAPNGTQPANFPHDQFIAGYAATTNAIAMNQGRVLSDDNVTREGQPDRETLQEAPTVDSRKTDAATLARDGQMLYEMGKLDEANLKLHQALELDPDNRGADYYLQLVKQASNGREDVHKNPIAVGQEKSRIAEAPEVDKKIDRYLAMSPATNAAIPQPEILTSDNAFSTFSMNVSDVSFKLAMASLQKEQMPNPASIRSEEFINAFDYHDPEPLQGEPLGFISERASDPFAHERDFLRFSIKAAAAGRQNGRALNIVLLLDTSGSMERADRVDIIREALRVLSAQLQPQDIVSVVTFARTARLWADGIPGNEAGATLDQVGSITPEGGTNLEEAMRLAYETALRHFISGGINRVVLLTDGAANLGNVDPQALTQKVDSERRQGIALDCFGIGWDDYNDDLLEQLSSNGDGRYAFINSSDEAATEFAAKLAGALEVAAEDVKVQVEFNPNRVTAWRQIGYAKHQLTKQQFRDNTVAAGAIASREAGNALYVIETNPDGQGPIATVRVRYRVPGTQDVHERSWNVDYDGAAPELAQSSPAMRLAVTAAEISEWMAGSPFAQDVTPDELLNYLSGVPEIYGTDERPKQLEWMMREAKSVSGK